MAKVFLSYSRADLARIERLADALGHRGHDLWWDRHLAGGAEFDRAIEKALRESDVVVVAWSQEACSSSWVRDEAAEGRDSGRMVPLTLDGTLPPLGFRQFHTIDLSAWKGRVKAREFVALEQAIAATALVRGAPAEVAGGPGATSPKVSPTDGRWSGLRLWPGAVVVAIAALLLLAGATWWLTAGVAKQEPMTVQLAGFTRLGSDVPDTLPAAYREELRDALGSENAVVVKDRGANFDLRGVVRRNADQYLYSIELKDIRDGTMLWAASREIPITVGERSAKSMAIMNSWVIRCGLSRALEHPRQLPSRALSYFLHFCESWMWGDEGGPQRTLDVALKLVEEVPDFARGWSAVAVAAATFAKLGPDSKRAQSAALADRAARKAIKLDPKNGEAYLALAELLPDEAWSKREDFYRRSVAGHQSDCGCEQEYVANFLMDTGRIGDAVAEYGRARDLEATSASGMRGLARAYLYQGDTQRAEPLILEQESLFPFRPALIELRVSRAMWTGKWAEAAAIAAKDIKDRRLGTALAEAFAALGTGEPGRVSRAGEAIEALRSLTSGGEILRAQALIALGRKPSALAAIESIVLAKGGSTTRILFDPLVLTLANEPAYSRLLHRVGLIGYWRETGTRPDVCKVGPPPGFCGSLARQAS